MTGLAVPGVEVLREGMTFEEWRAQAPKLGRVHRGIQWVIAGWVLYGEARFGERAAQAIAETGLAEQTVLNILSVARAFPPSRQREALSFEHHKAVQGLPAPEQDRLLDLAEKSALSVTALRREAAGARSRPAPAPIHDGTEPPHLVVGSVVRINAEGLCKISYIGKGATITLQAVRLT